MATNTANLSLIKPAGADKVRIAQINQNMDILDEKIGPVGNTSVQNQIIANDSGMAIVSTGNTHSAISSGQYVYIRSHGTLAEGLYKANSAISANATLSTSNVTLVSSGGMNDLKNQIDSLNSKLTRIYKKTITGTTSATGAIDSQINVDNNYIVSSAFVRGGGTAGFAFWRGNDGYLRCFDIDMQPLANTAVSIDIIYCKRSEVGTE